MREDVRRALVIDATSTMEDRTIDITTTGRRSGLPRRIEIVFYRLDDDIYLSGIPGPRTRDWLANLAANPQFIFHLKHDVVADLPATAERTGRPYTLVLATTDALFEKDRGTEPGIGLTWTGSNTLRSESARSQASSSRDPALPGSIAKGAQRFANVSSARRITRAARGSTVRQVTSGSRRSWSVPPGW